MYAKHDNMSSPLTSELVIHGQFFFTISLQFSALIKTMHINWVRLLDVENRGNVSKESVYIYFMDLFSYQQNLLLWGHKFQNLSRDKQPCWIRTCFLGYLPIIRKFSFHQFLNVLPTLYYLLVGVMAYIFSVGKSWKCWKTFKWINDTQQETCEYKVCHQGDSGG